MKKERSLSQILFEPKTIDAVAPVSKVVFYLILGLWTLVCLFPLYWLVVTSLKLPIHVNDGPMYLPGIDFKPSLHAWKYIFVDLGNDTLRPYLNTVLVSLASSVIAVVIGSMAGYALTRIAYRPKLGSILLFILTVILMIVAVVRFGLAWQIAVASGLALFILLLTTVGRRFRKSLHNTDIAFFMISQRILPPVAVVIPIYVLFQRFGLLDTHAALVITYVAVNLPIVVWLMRDFFDSVPVDLEESASLDGASRYRIFFTIVLPLAKPGLAATFLLVLILCWNEYLIALFLSTANAQTLPLLVAAQNATRGPQWWYMSVLIIIMVVPVVAITVVLQRFITRGLLIGAVKG
ncbi:MAG: carbohydrate ABC transporter permease [Desulfobacterales bacterium]|nr:MAG: carbohydrate ABC transporter permease [Desulfobacterales bacterium]